MERMHMRKLEALIHNLESYVPQHALLHTKISKGSIGWHIEHCLLTIDVVVNALKRSDGQNYQRRFDFRRFYVLTSGKIPRGKVEAPTLVRPVADLDGASLRQHLSKCMENISIIEHLSSEHFFTHPFLGDFKLKPAVKFLAIHTHHHVNIIKDIIQEDHRCVPVN